MIEISNKENCCGCSACIQVCPIQCISFDEDVRGFRYPLVYKENCIDCGQCEIVCPCLNQGETKKPLKVYAAINPNEEIRMKSSSGGIFSMLAEEVIERGGVVFGARFDDKWEVMHDYTETIEGLDSFRGSKYVQSRIGETYKQARNFLKEGRNVLFSGTSCQIAGLHKFLRKEYNNLITIDLVCHGVPSPLVWRKYLNYCLEHEFRILGKFDKKNVAEINFRNKSTGWKKFGLLVKVKSVTENNMGKQKANEGTFIQQTLDENLYLRVFLNNLCLRPSCHNCPAKAGKSKSDITIADYWEISKFHPELDDDKGVSAILVNSLTGINFIKGICAEIKETTYEQVYYGNHSIEKSVIKSPYSLLFWTLFEKNGIKSTTKVFNKMRLSCYKRALNFIFCKNK